MLPLLLTHFGFLGSSAAVQLTDAKNAKSVAKKIPGICSLFPTAHCVVTDPQFGFY
jgi:hypothetical protein